MPNVTIQLNELGQANIVATAPGSPVDIVTALQVQGLGLSGEWLAADNTEKNTFVDANDTDIIPYIDQENINVTDLTDAVQTVPVNTAYANGIDVDNYLGGLGIVTLSAETGVAITNIETNGGTVSEDEKIALDVFIKSQVTSGNWPLLDFIAFAGFADSVASLTDLKSGKLMVNNGATLDGETWSFNGTSDYINTGFDPSTDLSGGLTNMLAGCYSHNEITKINSTLFGCGSGVDAVMIWHATPAGYAGYYTSSGASWLTPIKGMIGKSLWTLKRESSANHQLMQNGVQVHTNNNADTTIPPYDIYIGARNWVGTANLFCPSEISLFFAGKAIGFDHQNFYASFEDFRTTLHPEKDYQMYTQPIDQGTSFRTGDATWIYNNFWKHYQDAYTYWNVAPIELDANLPDRTRLLNKHVIATDWTTNAIETVNTYRADFNGTSSYFDIPYHSDFSWGDGAGNDNPQSITLFMNLDTVSGTKGVVGRWDVTTEWLLYVSGTTLIFIHTKQSGGNVSYSFGGLEADTDYFVSVRYNGVPADFNTQQETGEHGFKFMVYDITNQVILNPQLTNNLTTAGVKATATGNPTRVGKYSTNEMDGELWDLRFYNAFLGAEDMERAYQGQAVSSCYARYEMNGNANDTSGSANVHNGTATDVTFNSATQVTRDAIFSHARYTDETGDIYPIRYNIDHYWGMGYAPHSYLIKGLLNWDAYIDGLGSLFGGTGTEFFGYTDLYAVPQMLFPVDKIGSTDNFNLVQRYWWNALTMLGTGNAPQSSSTHLSVTTHKLNSTAMGFANSAKTGTHYNVWGRKHF